MAEHDRKRGNHCCHEICFAGVQQMVGENTPQEPVAQSCYGKGLRLLTYKGITFALQNTGGPKVINI